MTSWAGAYVGLPFVDRGRDETGLDCWGLVRLVLAREAGIDVPSYGEVSAAELASVARSMASGASVEPWQPVSPAERRSFDVVVMSGRVREDGIVRRAPVHVGILVQPNWLLHVESATDSCIVALTHPTVCRRINGIYRHRDLA